MMMTDEQKHEFYQALVDKNPQYDGTFFAGIKTTGIFCHATCTARKPKYENCEFFFTAEEALLAGYRPCKRCTPLTYPNSIPEEVKTLVSAVEESPEKRWKEEDFRQLGIHSATARRKFKEIYGMTFVQYARSRRMGLAFKEILNGKKVIDQQVTFGYESSSAFNDAFTKIMGNPPKKAQVNILHANFISTPIGRMMSISDATHVYLLEFMDRRGLEREIENIRKKHHARILVGETNVHQQLAKELALYFEKKLTQFTVPLAIHGTPFQKRVWIFYYRFRQAKRDRIEILPSCLAIPIWFGQLEMQMVPISWPSSFLVTESFKQAVNLADMAGESNERNIYFS